LGNAGFGVGDGIEVAVGVNHGFEWSCQSWL
jgi:hypothetical protein